MKPFVTVSALALSALALSAQAAIQRLKAVLKTPGYCIPRIIGLETSCGVFERGVGPNGFLILL